MANEEHLHALNQGVDVWNQWREQNSRIQPDLVKASLISAELVGIDFSEAKIGWVDLNGAHLSNAQLAGADLREANLSNATLRGANVRGANLNGADLSGANLRDADLRGATLCGAKLINADLVGASLREANLSWADLSDANLNRASLMFSNLFSAILSNTNLQEAQMGAANFSGANLSGADVHGALMGYTTLVNTDLKSVKGLETVVHNGPSGIGIETIFGSQGKIPLEFLRGAGVHETLIDYMNSLVGKGFEYYSCFISYSSKDHQFAERLYADLQSKGIRCWFASEDLKIGSKLRSSFDEAIRLHDKLMVVLSESSVKSPWVEKEVETAFEKEHQQTRTVLFPIRLDDTVMKTNEAWAADIRRTRHIGDFCKWRDHDSYQKAFDRLLRDLKAESKVGEATL